MALTVTGAQRIKFTRLAFIFSLEQTKLNVHKNEQQTDINNTLNEDRKSKSISDKI